RHQGLAPTPTCRHRKYRRAPTRSASMPLPTTRDLGVGPSPTVAPLRPDEPPTPAPTRSAGPHHLPGPPTPPPHPPALSGPAPAMPPWHANTHPARKTATSSRPARQPPPSRAAPRLATPDEPRSRQLSVLRPLAGRPRRIPRLRSATSPAVPETPGRIHSLARP